MKRKYYLLLGLAVFLILGGAGCVQFGGQAKGTMGVYRSADGGEQWFLKGIYPTPKGVLTIAGVKVYRFFSDPSDDNAIYLGSRGQGLYYTYDNADTWKSSDAMNGLFIYALTVDPKNKCVIYASDGPHVFKTKDCMRTWSTVFTEAIPSQRFVALVSDIEDSNIIYGAEISGDILRSLDGGGSWRIVKRFNFELRDLVTDASGKLYAASYKNGLYRSDDGGDTWKNLSDDFKNHSDSMTFYRLILNPAQRDSLFWISKYGILRSDDAGVSWTDIKLLTPPGSVNIYAFAINPNNQKEMYYTGTILGDKNKNVRSTLYKSTDGGENWITKKLPTNTIPVDMRVHPDNGKVLFLGFTVL